MGGGGGGATGFEPQARALAGRSSVPVRNTLRMTAAPQTF